MGADLHRPQHHKARQGDLRAPISNPHAVQTLSGRAPRGQLRKTIDSGVALRVELTLRRRRYSHAVSLELEGGARLRPGHARLLPRACAFVRADGRGGRQARPLGQARDSVIPALRARTGSTGALRLADLASIVSARTGSIASASTTASTASDSTALAGISFSSAAGAGVGAVGVRSRFRRRSEPILCRRRRAGHHQYRRRSRSRRRRGRLRRRLRHPQAQLRQHRQICR